MSEVFGWMMITGAVVAYMRSTPRIPTKVLHESPSPEDEVDPTRWRHNGEQTLFYKEGNQAPFLDEQVSRLALAF